MEQKEFEEWLDRYREACINSGWDERARGKVLVQTKKEMGRCRKAIVKAFLSNNHR